MNQHDHILQLLFTRPKLLRALLDLSLILSNFGSQVGFRFVDYLAMMGPFQHSLKGKRYQNSNCNRQYL